MINKIFLKLKNNRLHWLLLLLSILCIVIISGVRCVSHKIKLNSKITRVFSHEVHRNVIGESSECSECHPQHKEDNSLKEQCHKCHNNPESTSKAPKFCYTCHYDLNGIKPDTHTASWDDDHTHFVKAQQSKDCYNCHRRSYCTDCHTKRDEIRKRMHTRNFVFYHSVEARANPYKCSSCHVASFCTSCHQERGVSR